MGKLVMRRYWLELGLERLEFYDSESTQIIIENKVLECLPLSVTDFIPAAGQGAIAIETLADASIVDSLKLINDVDTEDCVGVEKENSLDFLEQVVILR